MGATMIGLGNAIGMPLRSPFHITVASPEQLDDDDPEMPFDLWVASEEDDEAPESTRQMREQTDSNGSRRR